MTEKLKKFVVEATQIVSHSQDEAQILQQMKEPFARLLKDDDWLPEDFAQPHPERYTQYLLHCDAEERFSIVSFVWGPGQTTPIHNHTVWGMIGMLRGSEISTSFEIDGEGGVPKATGEERLEPGMIDLVSPALGDIHQVSNAHDDQVSISIHVYGANIGRVSRNVFDPKTGAAKDFISGFSSDKLPNIWA